MIKKILETKTILLQDGSENGQEKKVNIIELTFEQGDRWFEEQQKIYEAIKAESAQVNGKVSENPEIDDSLSRVSKTKDTDNFFINSRKSIQESYHKGLKLQEPIWQIMTGEEDVSWIYQAFPGDLKEIQEIFENSNPQTSPLKKIVKLLSDSIEDLMILSALNL